jgi:hypothetical protein
MWEFTVVQKDGGLIIDEAGPFSLELSESTMGFRWPHDTDLAGAWQELEYETDQSSTEQMLFWSIVGGPPGMDKLVWTRAQKRAPDWARTAASAASSLVGDWILLCRMEGTNEVSGLSDRRLTGRRADGKSLDDIVRDVTAVEQRSDGGYIVACTDNTGKHFLWVQQRMLENDCLPAVKRRCVGYL